MEMESSRRSLDRSKEPGILKKPRLAEPADRDPRGVLGVKGTAPDRERSFLPRGGPGGLPDPVAPRYRAGERERELDQSSSGYRGGSYQQQQQMQELATQYKTALAELTFNSKPIITNLTIIAGENLHAAKVIGAIVCANILEVPSEQKLPSLYLLDSIVKNIGRDYIKYFATKLPEVFCKAYKQVDSSIHPGMRHLFGTWKGVFPPAPLLAIEKELGFPPTINGASSGGGGGSRSDSQAQRPPRSIHVNPKYLEARQHLQQPSQNIPQPQRESPNESAHEKSQDLSYGERDFVSGYPRHSSSGISKISGRFMDREIGTRPLGSGGKDTREAVVSQRTGFDVNPVKNYISGQAIVQPSSSKPRTTTKSNLKTSQNWKNSEEEEYMWDDVNSRLVDSGSANSSSWSVDGSEKSASLHRAKRPVPEIEHLESKWNMLDSLSQSVKDAGKEDRAPPFRETEGHIPAARLPHDLASRSEREPSVDSLSTGGSVPEQQTPGLWSSQKMKVPFGGLDHLASRTSVQQGIFTAPGSDELSTTADLSFPRTGVQYMGNSAAVAPPPLNSASMHTGVINNKHQQTLRPPSPSADTSAPSTFLPHQGSHTIADHDRLKPQRPTQLQGQSKQAVPSQVSPVSFSTCHQKDIQHSDILSTSQQLLTKTSLSSEVSSAAPLPFSQLQHQLPFLQHLESDFQTQQSKRNSDSSVHMQEPSHPSLGFSSTQANVSSGMSSSVHSTGHVLDQASASKLLAEIMKSGLISNTPVASLEDLIKPPLPSGPPPVQVLTTPPSSIPLSSAFPPISHSCIQTPATNPPVPALPPLPPGPPPQSLGASQPSSSVSTSMNPLSSLLSSLVAKGLISSGTKTSGSTMKDMANQHLEQSSLPTCTSMPLATSDSPVHPTSMSNEPPKLESCSPKCDISSKTIEEIVKGLLGMEFKPEIIRKFHQSVIDCLYDDLENQCMKCGLRFILKEDMERHFDWHAKFQMDNYDRASRKWYEDRNVVVAEHGGISCVSVCTSSETRDLEKREPMVPADEKQCICALCGEPFEDFYCEMGDEWMYRGTVYMSQAPRIGNTKKLEEVQGRLIVHAKCASKCTSRDVEVATLERAGG